MTSCPCDGTGYPDKCSGLIKTGTDPYSGEPVYAKCAFRKAFEIDRYCDSLVAETNTSLTIREEISELINRVMPLRARTRTCAHARTRARALNLAGSLGVTFPQYTYPPLLGGCIGGTWDTPGSPVEEEKNNKNNNKNSAGLIISEVSLISEMPKIQVLEHLPRSKTLQVFTIIEALLGVRSRYYDTTRDLMDYSWWRGDIEVISGDHIDILVIYRYDGRSKVPSWLMKPIVHSIRYRVDSGLPLVISFAGGLDMDPRDPEEEALLHDLSPHVVEVLRLGVHEWVREVRS